MQGCSKQSSMYRGQVVLSILNGLRRLPENRRVKTDGNSCITRTYGREELQKVSAALAVFNRRLLTVEKQDCCQAGLNALLRYI